MKTFALVLAVGLPLIAIIFLLFEMRRKELKSWQHYALLTILTIYASVLLLGISGNLASFGYGDAKVEFVNEKVEEAKNLLAEFHKLAKTTAELSVMNVQLTTLPKDQEEEIQRLTASKQRIADFLKNAGYSEQEVEQVVAPMTKLIQLESGLSKEHKP